MTGFALTLVLAAAFVHATWNFLAKRAGGGAAFVWLFAFLSAIIYFPLTAAIIFFQRPAFGPTELLFMGGSAALHLAYFLMLQRGYQDGDLSLVYPLARGTGPTLSTLAAILFFGEQPTFLALVGALLVISGVFVLTGGIALLKKSNARQSIVFGLLTGILIASYTLWDKYSVSVLLIPPLILEYGSTLGRVFMLAPYAYHHWDKVLTEWHIHRREALGVACLNPLSYLLILTALIFTPVSYLAPTREVSTLIAVLMGAGLLKEGNLSRRLSAASLIVLGVVALAFN